MREPYLWMGTLLAFLGSVSTLALILKANPGERPVDFKIRLIAVLSAHLKIEFNVQYRVPRSGPPPSPSGLAGREAREIESAEGGDGR